MSVDPDLAVHSLPFDFFLARHCAVRPDATAIVDGGTGESFTFRELEGRVARVAGWLVAHGVGFGDRVACLAPNSSGYLELLFALARIGAVAVPLNLRLSAPELAFNIGDAGAKAIYAAAPFVDLAEAAIAGLPAVSMRIVEGAARGEWVPYAALAASTDPMATRDPRVSGETLFMLLYTSGTTGRPKGCMILQRSWRGYAAHMASSFGMAQTDAYLAFLPFFHVAGFGTAYSQLLLGGTVVTAPSSRPDALYALIERHQVTVVFLVPGISVPFLQDAARQRTVTSSLRIFISGAGVERPEVVDIVERELGAAYYGIYGQTEAVSKISCATGAMIRANPGTYGAVLPYFDFRILDDEGRELPSGEVGELCLRGDTIMAGYWNRPEATAETLLGGWLHTGDLFMVDLTGHLRMVDRKKYLIKSGGENVYPREVELALLGHPAVADVAVIGIPDARWGEAVKAFVVRAPGGEASARELADFVAARIAGYKRPRYLAFVDLIPRNVSGKVLKNELAALQTTPEQKL